MLAVLSLAAIGSAVAHMSTKTSGSDRPLLADGDPFGRAPSGAIKTREGDTCRMLKPYE
jgi:hypothetical protein